MFIHYYHTQEILNDTSATKKTIMDETLHAHYDRSLSVNHALFEAYRVKYLKAVISSQLHSELQFHCQAVQELSAALQALNSAPKPSPTDSTLR